MSLAISSRSGARRIPFSDLQICGCCLSNGDEPLLTCAKCSVLVHAHCYYEFDKNLDPSTWLCQPCATLSPDERDTVTCCICNQPGGALKPTDDDGWAHVCCALWTPETYIPNGDIICGVTDIHVTRKGLRCTFCKKIGGCVQCSVGKCVTSFHLICACQHGLQLSLENQDGSLVPVSVCHRHKQLTRKLVKSSSTPPASVHEEDAICDVCGHDSTSENNDIVICDGCEIGVHQNCYGIESIPESQWFCQACSSDRPGKCILCSDTEGALKQTTNGDWVHVVCALWSHRTVFLKPSTMDSVTGLDRLLLDDPDRQCQFCRDAVGFCCDCAATGCSAFYHVRCARKDKRRVEFYDLDNPLNPLSVLPRFQSIESQSRLAFVLYCNAHHSFPFSSDDYQRDHPFPCLENDVQSDNEITPGSPTASETPKKRNRRASSGKVASDAFVDDGKRSQAEIFWQDEIQPYFEPPRLSALRLSKDLERDTDMSFMVPPLGKIRAASLYPLLPSYKSCDWICKQLDIPCVNAQRLYALLLLNNDAVFTNLHHNGSFINFCLVESSRPEGDLFQELSRYQRSLATQILELDGFRKRLHTKIITSPQKGREIQRDSAALHKDYVDMSHSQIVRLSLVAGFRDLDLAASDFTQEHFNTTCRVCFGTEGTEVNPIVICETCGLAVHKYCYGIESIPEDDWLCDPCCSSSCPPASSECALCPLNGFAFKPSDLEGHTVHLVCAFWCPQVQVPDMVKMAPVANVPKALSAPKFVCNICNQDDGVVISCCHLECSQRFHVTCAWEFGLFMEVKSINGKPLFNCFCVPHTPEKAGGPERNRLKQHELRLKARTQKPASHTPTHESCGADNAVQSSVSANPRVLDGEDTYLPDVCAVCFSSTPDSLIKCVNCSIAVHRQCYGVDDLLEKFRCVRCTAQPQRARKISCVYCPRLGGAYERHETSRWRHKACEKWSSIFRNNGDRIYAHAVCVICDRKEGSCISCTALGCTTKFHALCGLFVGCELHCEDDVFTALCPLHTPIHGDSNPAKDGNPDIFVFYDRLRLVRADMDELRTIMDLVKRREKIKKNLSALSFQIASKVPVQDYENRVQDDNELREIEQLEVEHRHLVGSLQRIMEEDLKDGEASEDPCPVLNRGETDMIVDHHNSLFEVSPDRSSMDVMDGSLHPEDPGHLEGQSIPPSGATCSESAVSPRRLSFGASLQDADEVEVSCHEIEGFHLTENSDRDDIPLIQAAKDDADSSEPAVKQGTTNDGIESSAEPADEGSDLQNRIGHADDRQDDEGSDDENRPARRDASDEQPRRRRKAKSSSDEQQEDDDADESSSKQLVTVHERRFGRFAIQFRIRIDRSQLPPSTNVKIKKALLNCGSRSALRGRRRSRSMKHPSSDEDEESASVDHDGYDVEPSRRGRRRRSIRSTPESDPEDFISEPTTPARRHTQRTASLAGRRAKDAEEVPESVGRPRWFPDEDEYLHEIVEDLDTDPDWEVVAKMMEDKFGTSFRVYSKNVVQTRWGRSSGVASRKVSPAPPASESTSQRTRWPAEELEYLRSLVANGNEEGKRNWHEIVRQMKRKFGNSYRTYTTQILQSKVHRLMNAPEPSGPKESVRKPVVKPSSKLKWANEELEYLRGLVTKLGTDDWHEIANFMDKFLGERHRTYTGPILQKKWRELGPRGQAGHSQEIRDDMIANPEQHSASSPGCADENAASGQDEVLVSEEDFEEALSDHDSEQVKTVLKSPIIQEPDESEREPVVSSGEGTESQPTPQQSPDEGIPTLPADRPDGREETSRLRFPEVNMDLSVPDAAEGSAVTLVEIPASPVGTRSPVTGAIEEKPPSLSSNKEAIHEFFLKEPAKRTAVAGGDQNAMDLDSGPGHVELQSPLAQVSVPSQVPPPLERNAQQNEARPGNNHSRSDISRGAEEPFEEVPWHLEPEEDNELLRAPMQQPPLMFPQSAGDSLFPGPIPAYIMAQGERACTDQPKLKGNAWRTDEIEYLNDLGANPSMNKDWELIASKMSDKFGTRYRKSYLAASIKQRWFKANPRSSRGAAASAAAAPTPAPVTAPRPAAPIKEQPRRPASLKEPRRLGAVHDSPDEPPASAKEESEGISRTPYHSEELAYLAELVEQFGSKDWCRVAQRMQLRFNDKYRRYAAMSLSMKWTRLRTKNQLPFQDADIPAEETTSNAVLQPTSCDPSPENTVAEHEPVPDMAVESNPEETATEPPTSPVVNVPDEEQPSEIAEPEPESDQQLLGYSVDKKVSGSEKSAPELEQEPERELEAEAESEREVEPGQEPELVPELDQEPLLVPEPEQETEPKPVQKFSPVKAAVTPHKRGKTPWADEERVYFRSLVRDFGKDYKAMVPRMQSKFGSTYRQYTIPALHARWAKFEQYEKDNAVASEPEESASQLVEETIAPDEQSQVSKEYPDHVGEAAPVPVKDAELSGGQGSPVASPVPESAPEGDVSESAVEKEIEERSQGRSRRKRGSEVDVDSQEGSRYSRRSRRKRTGSSLLTRSPQPARVPEVSDIIGAEAALEAETVPESPKTGLEPPTRSRSHLSDRTPARVRVTEPEDTHVECETEVPGVSTPEPSSVPRRGNKARWLPDEIQFLRSTAQKESFEWNAVARLMNEKFGTDRRPNGYSAFAVMTIYRRRFPKDGAPAKVIDASTAAGSATPGSSDKPTPKLSKAIKEPKKRVLPVQAPESSSRQTRARDAQPVPSPVLPGQSSFSKQPTESPVKSLPSPSHTPVTDGSRRSPPRKSPSPKRLSLTDESAAIEKFAAAIESEPDAANHAPRRRRRTEVLPLTTPKRRRTIVPGTEPRKPGPARSRIPNQDVNRLNRLIENIQKHDFSGDQRSKALRFLRAHQSKWRQQRVLAPTDRAWVLDSWQFKPYEIKIVATEDNGERYRIHYLNWSSKFDEVLPGEFIFRDSPEIRQIRAMADTYSKGR